MPNQSKTTKQHSISEHEKLTAMFNRKKKILDYNNLLIIDTMIFLENFMLDYIVRKHYFSDNYDGSHEQVFKKFINERMTMMDRYKVVRDIAKSLGIPKKSHFTKIDQLIELRNNITHKPTSIGRYSSQHNLQEISLGGEVMTWDEYLQRLTHWANLSRSMANFLYKFLDEPKINPNKDMSQICYCEIVGEFLLVQKTLIYPEPDEEYTSFWKNGTSLEMVSLINQEHDFNKSVGSRSRR